jgi:hypothetical protein
MTWHPDMRQTQLGAGGECVRTIGWLHPDHPFPRGEASPEFLAKIRAFARCASHCLQELEWPLVLGCHTCEFCEDAAENLNIGVVAGRVLYLAPGMVAHYVEKRGYAPPEPFVAASCPRPSRAHGGTGGGWRASGGSTGAG